MRLPLRADVRHVALDEVDPCRRARGTQSAEEGREQERRRRASCSVSWAIVRNPRVIPASGPRP